MADLKTIIRNCFEFRSYSNIKLLNPTSSHNSPFLYMTIPINEDIIEVPAFAMYAFATRELGNNLDSMDALVIGLKSTDRMSGYKSIDVRLREALSLDYNSHLLGKVFTEDPLNPYYYCTRGAIFDKNLKPMCMLTWQMERVMWEESFEKWCYKAIRPIVRVAPSVFTSKVNAIERYIVNKIVPNALSIYRVDAPYMSVNPRIVGDSFNRMTVKVEIDDFSFKMSKVDEPSISTTNGKLLRTALDNIDEMMV